MKIKKGKQYKTKEGMVVVAIHSSSSINFYGVVIVARKNSTENSVGTTSRYWNTSLFKKYNTEIVKHKINNKTVILELNKKQRKLFKKLTKEYPNQRFIPYKKGYLDMTTGLLWEEFQDVGTYTHKEAIKLKKGKYKLPTIKELETLIDKSIKGRATKLPDMIADDYWSSSNYVGSFNGAWVVSFGNGVSSYSGKVVNNYVRCVTTGPLGIIYKGVQK